MLIMVSVLHGAQPLPHAGFGIRGGEYVRDDGDTVGPSGAYGLGMLHSESADGDERAFDQAPPEA
jgi:hypothetical protein